MADEQLASQLVTQPTLIGALVVAVGALAGVVVRLWRHTGRQQRSIDKERLSMADERKAWAVERETLRANFEKENVQILRDARQENRDDEAAVRKEFAELMERISAQAEKSADALSTVLQKFLERFLGPRHR